jgi:hypothetical protein
MSEDTTTTTTTTTTVKLSTADKDALWEARMALERLQETLVKDALDYDNILASCTTDEDKAYYQRRVDETLKALGRAKLNGLRLSNIQYGY